MPLGPTELIIILVILLLLFGAKRLPELGKSLGGGMREFKDSVTSKGDDAPVQHEVEARRESPITPTAPPTPEEQAPGIPSEPVAKPTPPPSDAG